MARTIYTAEKLILKVEDYFEKCKLDDDVPTIIGIQLFLKITENTVAGWKKQQKDGLLKHWNYAKKQIEYYNLQRWLKSTPNASAWYLERAFQEKYSIKQKLDINNNGSNTTPIIINLDNKGKNKC